MSRTEAPPGGESRRKTTLFCAECGHESGHDGDWIDWQSDGETLVCPDCGAVVVTQPDFELTA
jgi:transcription elongation factor Elf1